MIESAWLLIHSSNNLVWKEPLQQAYAQSRAKFKVESNLQNRLGCFINAIIND